MTIRKLLLTTLCTIAENSNMKEAGILVATVGFIAKNHKDVFKKQAKQDNLRLYEEISLCIATALWEFICEDDKVIRIFLKTELHKCKNLSRTETHILALLQQIVSHPILSDKSLEETYAFALDIIDESLCIAMAQSSTNTENIYRDTNIGVSEALLKWIRANEPVYNRLKQIATDDDI